MRSRPTCISLHWNKLSMSHAGWTQCVLMAQLRNMNCKDSTTCLGLPLAGILGSE